MIRQALMAAGLALWAAGCRTPEDYKIKAGRCKQDYECGIVCFSGMAGFDGEKGPEYIVTNTNDNSDKKGYPFYTGTSEIVMDECVFSVMQVNEDFIEYRARDREDYDAPQSQFVLIPPEAR